VLTILVVSVGALGGCASVQDELGDTPTATPGGSTTPSPTATPPPGGDNLTAHYLDVGQADATVIEFPNGEVMVIDTGDWRDSGSDVIAFLEARGIDRIDHLVATHPHADHIGGHAEVIEWAEREGEGVGRAYDSGVAHTSNTYEEYLDAVEQYDVDLRTVESGNEIGIGGTTVTFLNPSAELADDDLHRNSVSLLIDYGQAELLWTGDAEDESEHAMVDRHGDTLDADVYQAGHHGSRTSSSSALLNVVDPSTVVISSAYESQYGHPHNETLLAFATRGYRTYWTGVHGSVTITTDGEGLTARAEQDAPTDASTHVASNPSESRAGPAAVPITP